MKVELWKWRWKVKWRGVGEPLLTIIFNAISDHIFTWWLLQLPSADLNLAWKHKSEQSASLRSASHPDKLPSDDQSYDHIKLFWWLVRSWPWWWSDQSAFLRSDNYDLWFLIIHSFTRTYELEVCRWYEVSHWKSWEVVLPTFPHLRAGGERCLEVLTGAWQVHDRWLEALTGVEVLTGDNR